MDANNDDKDVKDDAVLYYTRGNLVSVHVVPRKIRNVLKVCQICA